MREFGWYKKDATLWKGRRLISELQQRHHWREKWGFSKSVLVFQKGNRLAIFSWSLLSFSLFWQLRSNQLRPWILGLSGFTTTTLSPGTTRTSPITTTTTTTTTPTTTTTVGTRQLQRFTSWKERMKVKKLFFLLLKPKKMFLILNEISIDFQEILVVVSSGLLESRHLPR